MDVVYICRDGDDNEELRYSLRSLANLDSVQQVWVFGGAPGWLRHTEVRHVPVAQTGRKHENTWANWTAIARHRELSDFIYMNDDMFILQPTDRVPTGHAGPLGPWIETANMATQARMTNTLAALRANRTLRADATFLSYELHIPMIMNRYAMREALTYGDNWLDRHGSAVAPLCKRSLYGNLTGIGGVFMTDVKVRHKEDRTPAGAQFVSTLDGSFKYGLVGRQLRARFDRSSSYELHPDEARPLTSHR